MIPNNLNEILEKHDQITNSLSVNKHVLGKTKVIRSIYVQAYRVLRIIQITQGFCKGK